MLLPRTNVKAANRNERQMYSHLGNRAGFKHLLIKTSDRFFTQEVLQNVRMLGSSLLSPVASHFRPLVVYEADIQFLAESTEHEKSVCVTPMRRHRLLHSAAIFTPGVA